MNRAWRFFLAFFLLLFAFHSLVPNALPLWLTGLAALAAGVALFVPFGSKSP
jgi:hypothetical protein